MSRLVAIHQPNFLPWLGFFDKLARADVFVLCDQVQLPKTGSSWTNRVKLMVAGKPTWVTVPLVRSYHGTQSIRDTLIDERTPWRGKVLKTLELNYRRAPFYGEVFATVAEQIDRPCHNLAEYNVGAIRSIAERLGIGADKLCLGSGLGVEGAATEMLVSVTRRVGGSAYLVGGGSSGYQEDELFANAGLQVVHQQFEHPIYAQFGANSFVPGLSIVDALMNLGFAGTRRLLVSGG